MLHRLALAYFENTHNVQYKLKEAIKKVLILFRLLITEVFCIKLICS